MESSAGESPAVLIEEKGPELIVLAALAFFLVGFSQAFLRGALEDPLARYVPFAVQGTVGLLMLLAASRLGAGRADILGLGRPLRGVLRGVLAYLAAVLPIMGLQYLYVTQILPPELRDEVQPTLERLKESSSILEVAATGVLVATVVPFFEETLFRGFLLNGLLGLFRRVLSARGATWLAVLSQAALFAVIHPLFTWLVVFLIGLLVGMLYVRTRNLWAVMAFHACHNAWTIIYFRFWSS